MSRNANKTRPEPQHDPIAPWCADVLRLFSGPLASLRFPDVDDAALAANAESLRLAQVEIERLERELDESRAKLREANAVFAELCARGLAYARVYASGQPQSQDQNHDQLRQQLDAVRPASTRAADPEPRRRGRPRKDVATAELIPPDAAAAE